MNAEALLADLTKAQAEAVAHTEGPILVVAGPGSGKTRVITYRIAYLIAQGIHPRSIWAVTFTNKAAEEMRNRIFELTQARGMTLTTFHSLGARLLRQYGDKVGLSENFVIYDDADQMRLLKEVLRRMGDPVGKGAKSKGAIRKLKGKISRAKHDMKTPDDLVSNYRTPENRQLVDVYRGYEAMLRENAALDFDDLLGMTVRLLRDCPEVNHELQRRCRYLMVDEYQDTNRAQYLIARGLTLTSKNLCVTGDPDQSIYGWRGADLGNILDFEKDFSEAKVVFLDRNYRSTAAILTAADELIANNRHRKARRLYTHNEPGSPPEIVACEDGKQEAEFVAERIGELINGEGLEPREIAVFYRINAMSRLLEQVLRDAKIPYQIVRGLSFFDRAEIKDILAYLRLLINPADAVSLERIINVPPRRIGQTTVEHLKRSAQAGDVPLFVAIKQADRLPAVRRALPQLKQFTDLMHDMNTLASLPVDKLINALIERTGLKAHLEKDASGKDRLANISEMVNFAADFEADHPKQGVSGFLERASLVSDVDGYNDSAGAVALMTLHAAKGLEFPAVFVVGVEEGLLPMLHGARVSPRDLEEERRLCFVGMTRAKRQLFLSYADNRTRWGSESAAGPSQFLHEIPSKRVQFTRRRPLPMRRSRGPLRDDWPEARDEDPHKE